MSKMYKNNSCVNRATAVPKRKIKVDGKEVQLYDIYADHK